MEMPTIRDYRLQLGWTTHQLARECGLPHNTVKRAEDGLTVYPRTAKAIADAISRGLGKQVQPQELEGVSIH